MGLVALLVSGSVFLINGAMYLRGSEIAVLPPDHFVLYRDTGPAGSDLYLAVPVAMINAASADYGDVVVRASATISSARNAPASFSYEAVVEPVMTPNVEQAVAACPHGARCIPAQGFYVIERPARLMDVPGGTSRSEYLSFMLSSANCVGAADYCAGFDGFDQALVQLRAEPAPIIRVQLETYFDGRKVLECRLPADAKQRGGIYDYLARTGWAMPGCSPVHERSVATPTQSDKVSGRQR